ncbi:hypothetical protein B0F90DRAFT_1810368 [Multifurca ochricompacta]|uniref:ERCC4 domain-containing protein n=1 Tax=Multifurca ochricompacta TaxID=376703 RepID=A0AAD4M352_9AGAM|nr:hypothetical protein B0F90DRAFT_1810368 [Multifurca ochricompacta]
MSPGTLLSFHHAILGEIHDPSTSQLVLLARGLGLRKILCTLMQIYDQSTNLVLLVNASPEEEAAIGEELGIMGCRNPGLRIVDYEMGKKDRQDLYKNGGLISVTSRILVVDMLQCDLPTELVTGLLVLHAEKVTALSLEAFIVRLYREKNTSGFLKGFSDQPEHITSGLSPLRGIMKELQLHTVLLYPRFHQIVKDSLERKRADVIELYQPMTESMKEIHGALVQCMSTTLAELKRSNTTLDLDDLNVENAYFRSFDAIIRRQLDPVWHKVGPRTKQLVNDLSTLRRLLTYLLNYDPLAFHTYLETIIESNTQSAAGNPRQNQSPWLLTDAAHIIFEMAKRRCYVLKEIREKAMAESTDVIEISDDEDAWDALEEAEGLVRRVPHVTGRRKDQSKPHRPAWLPKNIEPVLEELPKWHLLAETLKEIEEEIIRQDSLSTTICGNNVVLVMTASTQTSSLLSEYLASMDMDAPVGQRGRRMLEDKLRRYLYWKARLSTRPAESSSQPAPIREDPQGTNELNPALRKKDRDRAERTASRRRVRGGAPATVTAHTQHSGQLSSILREEELVLSEFLATQANASPDAELALALSLEASLPPDEAEFEPFYGLLAPVQTVVVRAYADDSDDRILAELQPRFIVMYEPSQDFVRRIEVYKASNPGLAVRVYFMIYQMTAEEHKYLASLRKEKSAFERLIKERGTMLLPIHENHRAASDVGEAIIKTISSRVAGGQKELSAEQSRVIVDMREFRSTLPSLLHASKMDIVPATLTVGDYILTPDICVERKSIPDLVSSFNSGRLYTQCELMSVHYKQPILLIEFEEQKSFSLEIVQDVKSYVKPTGKYPPRTAGSGRSSTQDVSQPPSIQQKLVLLTLAFPRVRILWSSSPYATADIFKDLKADAREPDYAIAVAVGADSDPAAGQGLHGPAEELLRTLPGITVKNAGYVISRVRSIRELCELDLQQLQDILGNEPGKACWEFLHWGEVSVRSGSG